MPETFSPLYFPRWLGNVLQRSVHYLRTMCRHLELNGRNRQKKSQETAQKLKILKEKANGVIVRLYDEMEQSLVNICAEVRRNDAIADSSTVFLKYFSYEHDGI